MQNPFLRLKHYRTDQKENDPKENHATEALAACLVFSTRLRAEFLSFLFAGERQFAPEEAEKYAVLTQIQTDLGGWVDLLIEHAGICSIVVEVKVNAPEDGNQIKAYRDWLDKTRTGDRHVFWLVQRPTSALQIERFGGKRRCTWLDLYRWLPEHNEGYSNVERTLVQNFCAYLEAESIVNTWTPTDLLGYRGGTPAIETLEIVFSQLETRLLDCDQDYIFGTNLRDEPWPRLEVGKKSWQAIFGPCASHKKVYVYYQREGTGRKGMAVAKAQTSQFYVQILLWSEWHKCAWDCTNRKLPTWLPILRQQGFKDWAVLRTKDAPQPDALNREYQKAPSRINAVHSDETVATLTANEISNNSNVVVVDELFKRVIRYCDAVSQLT